jgi:hypothetical protein
MRLSDKDRITAETIMRVLLALKLRDYFEAERGGRGASN